MNRPTNLVARLLICGIIATGWHAGRAQLVVTAADETSTASKADMVVQVIDSEGHPKVDVPVRFHVDKKIETLNTNSAGEVRWTNVSPETAYVSVNVKLPGYVSMRAQWNRSPDSAPLFERLEFRLEKGTKIGGRIRDEQGKPIADARVHVLVPTDRTGGMKQPYVSVSDVVERTDADGKWVCDIIPADARNVWIRLEHDDYVSDRMFNSSRTPSIEALRAGTGTMTLRKGLPVSGTVVDADGHPVAGAIVNQGLDRLGSEDAPVKTDEEGRYRFRNCPPGPTVLTVVAPGWMPDLKRVTVVADMGSVDFRLSRGKTIRVRVVDEKGKPVDDTWIAPETWRDCRTLNDVGIPRSTNVDGIWQWTWAPDDAVVFDVLKPGYMDVRGKKLTARDEEYVIALHRPLTVTGRVVDVKTKEPIEGVRVVPGIAWDSAARIAWEQYGTATGRHGNYHITITDPQFAHVLRVEADGYLPAVSRRFKDDEGAVTYDAELEKGTGFAGIVVLPDKKPAAGATLVLCPRGQGISVSNGSIQQTDAPTTRSDDAGKFAFPPQTEACDLLVMHDQGARVIKNAATDPDMRLELKPWARLEGTAKIGAKPAVGQTIAIIVSEPMQPDRPRFWFSYKTTADENGHFQFDRILECEGFVGRMITFGVTEHSSASTVTNSQKLKFIAGKTTRLQIGGTGRPVIGRLTLPSGAPEVNWDFNTASLRPKPSLPSLWDILEDALGVGTAPKVSYACTIAADGSFRMEDVPSGYYELVVRVMAPPTANQVGASDQVGYVNREVSVPEIPGGASDEPLDLGSLPIKVWKLLKIGDAAPDFTVTTLDGKTLRLADLHGKYVLVDFWATWCGPCRAELPHLKTVYERFGNQKQFVMVGLSSDRSEAPLRKYVDENKMTWSQALLSSDSATPTDYGVRGIPSIFLIGPDGTVVAKDLRGPATGRQLEQVLTASATTPADEKQPAGPNTPVPLIGTVVDVRGAPLAGATVSASSRKSSRFVFTFNGVTGSTSNSIVTDAQGHFTFSAGPDGAYLVGQSAPLHIVTADHHDYDVNALVERETTVHVPTLANAKLLKAQDVAVGELAGMVVDDDGKPLEGVEVDVWDWYPGNETTSDKNGLFQLKGFDRDEKVEVRFRKSGYSPETFIDQPTGVSGWVIVLGKKTFFEGTVRGPDGKPAPGARVRADQGPKYWSNGILTNIWTETTADEAGHYRLYVQPDLYQVSITASGVGVARIGDRPIGYGQSSSLDINLQPGVTFRAKVVDSQTNEPVMGVRLWNWQHKGIEGRSDADGMITIAAMLPGDFQFQVEAKDYTRWWSEQGSSPWVRKSIDDPKLHWQRNFDYLDFVLKPEMAPVEIVVEKGVRVRGRVVDPEARPVVGATVAPAKTGSGNSLTGDTRFSVKTTDGGKFEVLLPASNEAQYNLVAHDGDYGQWRHWANGVLPPIRTKPGEEMNDVVIALTRPAEVRGKVVDQQGKPLAYCDVRAAAVDKLENRYYDPTIRTKADGTFELKFIRPGEQFIQVPPFYLMAEQGPPAATKRVTLEPGQILTDVELKGTKAN